jgi:hypothetical protein
MEQFQTIQEQAKKNIIIADHMLIMTFPLVKDPKLLLAVVDNIHSALINTMSSLVEYERLFKRVPPFADTFQSKFNIFQGKLVERYKINKEYSKLIQEIRDIIVEHKNSPIEFARNDKFVICSSNYRMRTLGVPEIKMYIAKTKLFIEDISRIVSKNDGMFR